MNSMVGFQLDADCEKHFLERMFIEKTEDNIIIGAQKPDGSWYVHSTISEERFIAALTILDLVEAGVVGFDIGQKVTYTGTKTEGIVLSTPEMTQVISWPDGSKSAIPIANLRRAKK